MQIPLTQVVIPKQPPVQLKFRWDAALVDELRAIAEATGNSMNDAAEMLVRFAIETTRAAEKEQRKAKK